MLQIETTFDNEAITRRVENESHRFDPEACLCQILYLAFLKTGDVREILIFVIPRSNVNNPGIVIPTYIIQINGYLK